MSQGCWCIPRLTCVIHMSTSAMSCAKWNAKWWYQAICTCIEYHITTILRIISFHFMLVLVWTTQVGMPRQVHTQGPVSMHHLVMSSCKKLRHNYPNISIIIMDIKNWAPSWHVPRPIWFWPTKFVGNPFPSLGEKCGQTNKQTFPEF